MESDGRRARALAPRDRLDRADGRPERAQDDREGTGLRLLALTLLCALVSFTSPARSASDAQLTELHGTALELNQRWLSGEPGAAADLFSVLSGAIPEVLAPGVVEANTGARTLRAWFELFVCAQDLVDRWRPDPTLASRRETFELLQRVFEGVARASEAAGRPETASGVEAGLLLSEAGLLQNERDFAGALRVLDEVIDRVPGADPFGIGARARRADVRIELGEVLAAEAELDEAEQLVGQWEAAEGPGAGDYNRWRIESVRVRLYSRLGLADVAAACSSRELELAARIPDDPLPALQAKLRRADLLFLQARHGEAEVLADDVLARLANVEPTARAGLEAHALAFVAFARTNDAVASSGEGEELAQAVLSLERAIDHEAQSGDVRLRARVLLLSLLVERAVGDDREERIASALAAARRELGDASTGSESLRARIESLAGLAALRREPRDRAGLGAAHAALRDSFRELVDSWDDRPARAGGEGFLNSRERREMLAILVDLALEIDGPEAALGHVLRAQGLGTLSRRTEAEIPGLERVRSLLLDGGAGALVLLPSDRRSHLFLVDGDDVAHRSVPGREVLVPWADGLNGALAGRESEDVVREAAAAVAGELFDAAAVGRLRSWSHLHVVGAELVNGLPFELLPLPDGESSVELGVALAVSHLPSFPVGAWLATRAAPRATSTSLSVVVASEPTVVPGGSEKLVPFRLEGEDRSLLTAGFAEGEFEMFEGAAATSGVVDGRAHLLYVVAHGIQDDRDASVERSAALVLAQGPDGDDGILTCDEVEQLDVAQVVVLAACAVGQGPERLGGEGSQHLGGAFFVAGADVVVLSSERLELSPTLELLAELQRSLRAGGTVAEAMRDARAALARRGSHPAHRALLRVVGLGRLAPFRGR